MMLPLSPRMSYGQMRMALYDVAPELTVSSALLPGNMDGLYCRETNTILIDRRVTYTRKRCILVHELIHWEYGDDTTNGCAGGRLERRCRKETALLLVDPIEYGDDTTNGCAGGRLERRCRKETALLLVDPIEYATAEQVYEGNPYRIASELDVTLDVINDYRQLLHDRTVV